MLKKLLLPLLSGLAGTSMFMLPAKACELSYIILPDGSCLDVSYLSILGTANGEAKLSYQEFSRQYTRMATRYVNDFSTPEGRRWALDFGIRTTEERLDIGAAPELENALSNAVDADIYRDSIEDLTWPLHTLTLSIVKEAFNSSDNLQYSAAEIEDPL